MKLMLLCKWLELHEGRKNVFSIAHSISDYYVLNHHCVYKLMQQNLE